MVAMQFISSYLKFFRTLLKVKLFDYSMPVAEGLHIGKGGRLWAPKFIRFGRNVYLGRFVDVETNVTFGDNVLIANHVKFSGRRDHDYKKIGTPVRFGRWSGYHPTDECISIGSDVWIGVGAIILGPINIGSGAIIAAGSIVFDDVEPYTIVRGNPACFFKKRFSESEQEMHIDLIKSKKFQYNRKGLKYSEGYTD